MKKVLGLDIGISSVGWGIIDQDSGEIIDAGVRLFEEATRNANEERRSFRGARRLKRRRAHRLERACKLFKESNLPTSMIGIESPYEARYDAIYGEVSKERLVVALYHLVKKRGTTLDIPDEDKTIGNELSTKEQLSKNRKLLDDKFICEVQLERLANKQEKMRNHENRFRTEDYVNETLAILNKQKEYHKEITDEFINQFISLIEKRRQYYEGPGSEKSLTPYGPYFLDEEGKLTYISMIDKMRGKCTYLPDELRIAKMSFTADLFNLLSGDLNKLQIRGEYLSFEDKLYLFENFIKKGKNLTVSQIMKYKGVTDETEVIGYRVNLKTNKPIFTEFKGYKTIKNIIEDNHLPDEILNNIDVIDEITEILTAEKSYQRRAERLKNVFTGKFDEKTIKKIIDSFKENSTFTGYHSLSKKVINSVLDELWHTNKNQMQIFSERGLEQNRLNAEWNHSKIKFDDAAILSTVAKRAHREAIKIVNSVRQKHGELHAVVIETAREKNSDEEKNQYKEFQKKIGKHEKEMAKLLGVKSISELKLNSKQNLALKLWVSQDYKCVYSGKSISIHDIVSNPSLFEIDHIIPISISFDDSQANKVLCYHGENQNKGQKTPYQYFSSGKAKRSFEQFKVDVTNLFKSKRIPRKKKDYLLEIRDIENNVELQKDFINRNLVDTQYAMRSFSNTLRNFYKTHDIRTKVMSIRGSFTAALRRRAKLTKNRDAYAHHAIDALIVAAIGRMPIFNFFKEFDMNDEGIIFSRATGEIINDDEFFHKSFSNFLRNLMNYEPKIKYSHKVDRKVNRTMSNRTIYGTREHEGDTYYLGKSGNIYQLDKQDVESLLKRIKKNPESFLIAKYNPELFSHILKIIKEYSKADNPFKAYYDENGYIMKDGKVPVKNFRYYDRKLRVHMNITDKYPNANNDVVLLTIKSLRIDVYKNKEGKYKYLGVPYYWFKQVGRNYVLDMDKYNEERSEKYKKIDHSFEFQFSLYKNDRFSFEKNGEYFERVFRGDAMPRGNKIEVDFIYMKKGDQKDGYLAPGTLSNVIKYNVDVLGNTYKIEKENFKDYLQL
ncbi:type II CRISPR RNA-guided endonuclease Cas9 [Bacillus sp. PS06]|uniref:type II CRISPR RNA-guided endonuclease Cas9 n=1 Tax=Bacillus sp. PS06 TaxID=2764176 RepID=UPI001780AC37|nr:type II CRISPR RNA-guided endonuclease Cas9 [Bacillus sp. PS06]MBD8069862.1 type II CRISPR RNA-guided endonuclease Cas9 [Bacillus sp. PS06]